MRSAFRSAALVLAAAVPALLPALLLVPALAGRAVPSFRDQSDFFYPAHRYTAARIAKGELPLWNSLSGNGETWIGNGQNEIFYPPAWLFLDRNGARASGGFLLFHFAAAYLLFFGFARARGGTLPAAILGSSIYAYSGTAVSLSAYWNHFAGFAWIPGMAWAAHSGLRTRKARGLFALFLALALLAGSPEAALFGATLAAVDFALAGRDPSERDYAPLRRKPGSFSAALALGVLLSAVAIVPLAASIVRAGTRAAPASAAVSPAEILSAMRAPGLSPYPWLPSHAGYLQSLYLPAPLFLLLALGAGLLPSQRREAVAWATVAVAGIAFSCVRFSFPFRYPAKLLMVALFAAAVLAAMGADGLRFRGRRRGTAWIGLALAAATFAAAVALRSDRALAATLAVSGIGLAAAAACPWDRARAALLAVAAPAAAIHLVLAARPLVRFASLSAFEAPPKPHRGKVLTSQDELLSGWANLALPDEDARVRRQVAAVEGYTNLLFAIPKATTASALPSREQAIFQSALGEADELPRAAAVAGCGEIRFPRGGVMARTIVEPTLSDASVFPSARRAPSDPSAALEELLSGRRDYRRTLLVSGLEAGSSDRAGGRGETFVLSRTRASPEEARWKVSLSEPVWLYRPQSWDPWWVATVDSAAVPIRRANGIFSAIRVPAGEHDIVWRYRPWPFFVGAGLSAIALLLLLRAIFAAEPAVRTRTQS